MFDKFPYLCNLGECAMEQEYHEMILTRVDPLGEEEWLCPICGRKFLLRWPPRYNTTILNPGDEYAIHTGGKESAGNSYISDCEEEHLEEFVEWMDRVNFEKFWSD